MKWIEVTAKLPVQETYIPGPWKDNPISKDQLESEILNGMSNSAFDDGCSISIEFKEE